MDEKPPIRISRPSAQAKPLAFDQDHSFIPETPEVASPDTPASKVLEESDPGVRLINEFDSRWIVFTPYALEVTEGSVFLDVVDTPNCGFILGKDNLKFCVHLIHETVSCDFKELLNKYYALGVLSRARCLDDELPWHLAVAKRAHNGVEAAMTEDNIL